MRKNPSPLKDTHRYVYSMIDGSYRLKINEVIYKKIMPLYFPRSKAEEQFCMDQLPSNLGNEMGEPVIEERSIRISDQPFKSKANSDNVNSIRHTEDNITEYENIGRHSFAHMNGDHDVISHERLNYKSQEEMRMYEQQKIYARWLKRSRTDDFSDLKKLKMIYHCGHDAIGRPVVIVIGRRYSDSSIDSDKLVGYLCGLLDKLVNQEYSIVYFDTMCLAENHPPSSFVKYVYRMLDAKYVRNLKYFYILHPTFRSKFMSWWFTTFTAPEVKDKVRFLTGVEYLYDAINPEQLDIPQFIIEYDEKLNGKNYYADWRPPTTSDL